LLKEESLLFVRVKEVYGKMWLLQAFHNRYCLAIMAKEKNLSGMIVVDEDVPVGVVTDRDLRDKVLAEG